MVASYSTVTSRLEPGAFHLGLVTAGVYLLVWSVFGAGAGLIEWVLVQERLIRESKLADPLYAGGLLILAGLYQWSAVKSFCLTRCRSPLGFLLQHHQRDYSGALKLGIRHAAFCVGCCWILMLLAWAGGAMNLAWMIVITMFVSVEKLLGVRPWFMRASAVTLLIAGAVEIAGPML